MEGAVSSRRAGESINMKAIKCGPNLGAHTALVAGNRKTTKAV
jgi:hypothetical protein